MDPGPGWGAMTDDQRQEIDAETEKILANHPPTTPLVVQWACLMHTTPNTDEGVYTAEKNETNKIFSKSLL
jgi:hypothetical protein